MTRRLPICTLALALAGAAQAAPTVAIVGIHQAELTPEAQQQTADAIARAMDDSGKADGRTPKEVHTLLAGKEEVVLREGLLGEGRRLFAEARNLYNQASWSDAIPVLESAIASLERSIPGSNTTRELWEAWVYLAACNQQLEAFDGANAAFAQAVALNANRQPDAAVFPPDLVTAFDAVRTPLLAQATTLEVAGDPAAEAVVWLDGENKGKMPLVVTGVLPGKHYLNLRSGAGQGSAEVFVPPAEGGAAPTAVKVDGALGAASLGSAEESTGARGRQNAAFYRALGQQTAADFVLLAGVDGSTLTLQLYSREIDAFSRATEIPVTGTADDEALAAIPLLLNQLGPDGKLPVTATVASAAPFQIGTNSLVAQMLLEPARFAPPRDNDGTNTGDGRNGPSGGAVAGIVVGAAVVAGGAVAAVVLLTGGDEEPAGTGVVTVGPF
jgi:tetratricopeptide (TPR) repeat protein